jgi:Cryptococcal mannosyltransferase 1
MHLLASLARRTNNLFSRRWLRLGICFAVVICVLDLWLTVRINAPRAKPVSPVFGESSSELKHTGGGSDLTAEVHTEGEKERREKLFVASIHWNDAEILSSHWIPSLLELVREYGASNLYISILESGSWDETKAVLRNLDLTLESMGVERSVVLDERSHEDEVSQGPGEGEEREGWIVGTRGRREMRRIPYLAAARNRAMAPLRMMAEKEGKRFDRVVWLNDVIFTVRLPSIRTPHLLSNQTKQDKCS